MDVYRELRWKEWLFRISLVLTVLSSLSLVLVLYFKIQVHIKSTKPCRMESFEYGYNFPGRNCYCIGQMVPSIRIEDSPTSSICKGLGLSWENHPVVSQIFFPKENASSFP